jgi:CHAD domain-containing protein
MPQATLAKKPQPAFRTFGEHMQRVLSAHRRAREDLGTKAVHDLRVALRSCLSVAQALRELDEHPQWRAMRRAGRRMFKALSGLRDTQVLSRLIKKLSAVRDRVSRTLLKQLKHEQGQLLRGAHDAVARFDRKRWRRWSKALPARADMVPLEDPAWEQVALLRWSEGEARHFQALNMRTRESYHLLRIAIKRLRYTVASFLPARALAWGHDLRRLQDVLGRVHDLDLLDRLVRRTRGIRGGARKRWRNHLEKEIQQSISRYRKLTMGDQSLWSLWRAGLPGDARLHESAVALLAAWAAFRDPAFERTAHVARLSLQLFDALRASKLRDPFHDEKARHELRAASFVRQVAGHGRGSHKRAARQVRSLTPPIGWSRYEMDYIADLVRYQRGGEDLARHRRFAIRPPEQQQAIARLAGVLRLAVALDADGKGAVKGLSVEVGPEALYVRAEGFDEHGACAQLVASAKALLEKALDRLVLVKAVDYAHAKSKTAISEEEE